MREKITSEEYKKIISMKPEKRTSDFGDEVTNKIIGILIAYSKFYDMRDGWIDIITIGRAEKEIKQLILDCGGSIKSQNQLEIDKLKKELEDKKKMNRDLWNSYGSELCAANMIEQENRIENKIRKLETIIRLKDAGLLDENDKPIPSKPDLEYIKKIRNGMDN